MKIFPSFNEKLITSMLVSFFVGAVIGFFTGSVITDQAILLTALATLAAAFFGAGAAYKIEDNKNKREHTNKCIESANNIIFALYERIKKLKSIQTEFINPHRNSPTGIISIPPLLDFNLPESKFNAESLLFLLETNHSQLILDLHTEKQCFETAFMLIKFRSELLFNKVQPSLQAGGIQEGGTYERQQIIDTIGELTFAQLVIATDGIIKNIDETIESSELVKTKLIKALKELHPNNKILNFEFRKNNG
nr:hypothetical protein [uncultured bacterium]